MRVEGGESERYVDSKEEPGYPGSLTHGWRTQEYPF